MVAMRIVGIVQRSVTLSEDTDIDGVVQGSVHIRSGITVELRGTIQGTTVIDPGARLLITGSQHGSVAVRSGAEVVVEPPGTLAGSLLNDGRVVVRGVFAGAQSGATQIELEGSGQIKMPDEIRPDGTHVYRW